jgi:hypothetical protein
MSELDSNELVDIKLNRIEEKLDYIMEQIKLISGKTDKQNKVEVSNLLDDYIV